MANTPQTPNFSSFGTAGQGNASYGQPRVTVTMPALAPAPRKAIHWGGMLKGAAIVTGVVVAAVAGFYAFQFGAGFIGEILATSPTTAAYVNGIGSWLTTDLPRYVGAGVGYVGEYLSAWFAAGAKALGFADTVVNTASLKATAGTVGAVAMGAAAIPAASHALQNTSFVTTTAPAPMSHETLTAHSANIAAMQESAHHAAHHVAHTNEGHKTSWTSKIMPSSVNFTSHADAARASKPEATITPRDTNFAAALNADREKLAATLGEKII